MKNIYHPEKYNYLKTGFLLCISVMFILFLQFLGYLYDSYLADSIDCIGWIYYLISSAGHAFLFSLIPFAIIYLPLLLLTRFYKTALSILFLFYLVLNIIAYVNGFVFQFYKFHINGFVIDMLFNGNAGQIFVFNSMLILKSIGYFLLILLSSLLLLFVCLKYNKVTTRRRAIIFSVSLLICVIVSHLGHAYAAAAGKVSIENAALCLPQFYPLTANRLMLKMGVLKKENFYNNTENQDKNSAVIYPRQPLKTTDTINRKNIVFLLIDSWNPRAFTPETSPEISRFAQKTEHYREHLSSSNGTRGGIFGWFFGLTPSYWKYFEVANIQPLFIERLYQLDYDIQAFASATLINPPFHKVIFGNVKNLRTETPGTTPFERDNRITEDFLAYLENQAQNNNTTKPFFAFLFYDLTHAIDLPKDYNRRFQPAWEYADYMQLSNNTDPVPFFNLYRNCAWHIDSLAGLVFHKLETTGLLENTIVIVSGDHGQEFNENHKNFWGHNGNFSNAQLQVPLLYYYPGISPREITRRTTHYDIVPTLMNKWLGVNNPIDDYCMGQLLSDSLRPPFHIAGSFDNYAIITDSLIYEKKITGRLVVTDRQLNEYKGTYDTRILQDALLFKNRFLRN